ncbi:MAG TPA: hypothetical protein VFW96_10395 [Thermomicrobiales bacterium]|nr:hypothetical protein [Thermomicrobiales bacterium]
MTHDEGPPAATVQGIVAGPADTAALTVVLRCGPRALAGPRAEPTALTFRPLSPADRAP